MFEDDKTAWNIGAVQFEHRHICRLPPALRYSMFTCTRWHLTIQVCPAEPLNGVNCHIGTMRTARTPAYLATPNSEGCGCGGRTNSSFCDHSTATEVMCVRILCPYFPIPGMLGNRNHTLGEQAPFDTDWSLFLRTHLQWRPMVCIHGVPFRWDHESTLQRMNDTAMNYE